ncbi:hypothetical protein [Streptomyces sp. x-80]|uniref:hypothetical protein n=1 Tax=Streptomyces sp. x-80 TaxID=2789282 RepID=UPI00397F5333
MAAHQTDRQDDGGPAIIPTVRQLIRLAQDAKLTGAGGRETTAYPETKAGIGLDWENKAAAARRRRERNAAVAVEVLPQPCAKCGAAEGQQCKTTKGWPADKNPRRPSAAGCDAHWFNPVTVLAQERDLTLRAAVDAAHEMLVTAVSGFTTVKQRHLGHDGLREADRVDAPRAADRWEHVVSACVNRHRTTSRYHVQAGIPVQDGHGAVHTGEAAPTLRSRQFEIAPYPLYERLRTTLPTAYDEPTDTWLLSRHADVRTAWTDQRFTNADYTWQITRSWAPASCSRTAASTSRTGPCSPRSSAAGPWPSWGLASLRECRRRRRSTRGPSRQGCR